MFRYLWYHVPLFFSLIWILFLIKKKKKFLFFPSLATWEWHFFLILILTQKVANKINILKLSYQIVRLFCNYSLSRQNLFIYKKEVSRFEIKDDYQWIPNCMCFSNCHFKPIDSHSCYFFIIGTVSFWAGNYNKDQHLNLSLFLVSTKRVRKQKSFPINKFKREVVAVNWNIPFQLLIWVFFFSSTHLRLFPWQSTIIRMDIIILFNDQIQPFVIANTSPK